MDSEKLTDGDYFKACGQDLQEGYTIVTVCGAKVKMLAEKREKDGQLQVVVIPQTDDVEFFYEDMQECLMGAQWKYKEPLLKVYGTFVIKKTGYAANSMGYVTSIFLPTVPEFTADKPSVKEKKQAYIFQKKSGW